MKLLPELKAFISATYDTCLICDELEIEPEDLLDAFENKLIEKKIIEKYSKTYNPVKGKLPRSDKEIENFIDYIKEYLDGLENIDAELPGSHSLRYVN